MYRQSALRPSNVSPRPKVRRKILVIFVAIVIALGLVLWPLLLHRGPSTNRTTSDGSQVASKPTFNKTQFSTNDPASLWVVVNKQHQLNPKDYAPNLVVPAVPLRLGEGSEEMHVSAIMAPALESLVAAAKQDGLSLMLASGYRSYNFQVSLYNRYVKSIGQTEADKSSARPGHSEHQTGLAADLEPGSRKCEIEACFANTPEGAWVAANAYKFGFIVRYTADKVSITGYEYEPWHVRYVGAELAAELHQQHIATLEEFFNVSGGTNY